MTEIPKSPPRLVHDESGNGELLRRANREFSTDIDEPHAFLRLDARLAKRSRHRRWSFGVAVAASFAAYAVYLSPPGAPPVEVTAELLVERVAPAPSLVAPASKIEPTEPPNTLPPSVVSPSASARQKAPVASRPRASETAKPAESVAPRAAPANDTTQCLKLAREGDKGAAEKCFEAKAAGSGLGAELSLYELSRLRRDLMDDPNGALVALDQHRERFPSGGLRAEVELTRVELLVKTGRIQEALAEVDRLLSSGVSREREAELRAIRETLRVRRPELTAP